MFANVMSIRRSFSTGLFGLAVAAGLAPAVSLAQDCKLSVHASPQVLYGGQRSRVNVSAHFPTPPALNAPYAFASASFDVLATDPMWSFATDGAIVGSDVLGIEIGQAHLPQQGIFADPSNPLRVWRGIFRPQSPDPALVEIEVDPMAFSVYPSELTSSAAACDVAGGNDYIFVNPLRVGRWLAAPGPGTTMEIQDDVVIDGRIITGENWDSVSIGILAGARISHIVVDNSNPRSGDDAPFEDVSFSFGRAPGTLYDSSTRVKFDQPPESFAATVQILGAGDDVFQWDPGDGIDAVRPGARRSRIGDMTVTFDELETGGHAVGANMTFMDGSVRNMKFAGYIGGVLVTSGDLGDGGDGQTPGLVVHGLPQTIEARVRSANRNLATANTHGGSTSAGDYNYWQDQFGSGSIALRYDQPVVAIVPNPNGPSPVVTVEYMLIGTIDVAPAAPAPQNSASNNLRQLSLGSHVFEAQGAQHMSIIPGQGD